MWHCSQSQTGVSASVMMDSIILYGKPVGFLVICCHTSFSWERKVWKMAKSNYTDASLMLLPCVFSCSSPLKVERRKKKKICYPQLYFTGRWVVQTCRCSAALLVVVIASSLTRQGLFFPAMNAGFGERALGSLSHRWGEAARPHLGVCRWHYLHLNGRYINVSL